MIVILLAWLSWRVLRAIVALLVIIALAIALLVASQSLAPHHAPAVLGRVEHGLRQLERQLDDGFEGSTR